MRRVTMTPTSMTARAPLRRHGIRALPADRRPARGPAGRAVGGWLPKITAKCFERYGFHTADIITNWPIVAGPELAALTVPERISWPRAKPGSTVAPPTGTPEEPVTRRGGPKRGDRAADGATLILRTDPASALDVEYRAVEIADKLNRYFGYRAIAQVKVRQGPIDPIVQPARHVAGGTAAQAITARTTPNAAAVADRTVGVATSATPARDLAAALASLAGAISAERSGR